jgi:hypothetical protein
VGERSSPDVGTELKLAELRPAGREGPPAPTQRAVTAKAGFLASAPALL